MNGLIFFAYDWPALEKLFKPQIKVKISPIFCSFFLHNAPTVIAIMHFFHFLAIKTILTTILAMTHSFLTFKSYVQIKCRQLFDLSILQFLKTSNICSTEAFNQSFFAYPSMFFPLRKHKRVLTRITVDFAL